MESAAADAFLSWFKASGGELGLSEEQAGQPLWGLHDFRQEGMGTGLIALQDIESDDFLFSIPRSTLLNTRNSKLPELIKATETSDSKNNIPNWSQIEQKWASLILCMLWERRRAQTGEEGGQAWGPYLDIMPGTFSTPMFWSKDDLKLLEGTSVEGKTKAFHGSKLTIADRPIQIAEKIGRQEAEAEYRDLIMPLLQGRPGIFLEETEDTAGELERYYGREQYHIMGSRILSRSFHVEPYSEQKAMQQSAGGDADSDDEMEGGEEEEEEASTEDVADISMVPMADMLNARPGDYHNAKLFYKPTHLEMRSTRPIKKGEQIYNTYADPPNSDLLRRYGYVDLNAASEELQAEGGADELDNPNDNVELGWDLVIDAAQSLKYGESSRSGSDAVEHRAKLKRRVEHFEKEGLIPDECMVFDFLAPSLVADEKAKLRFLQDDSEEAWAELFEVCKLVWIDDASYDKQAQKEEAPEAEWSSMLKDKAGDGEPNKILAAKLALAAVRLRLKWYPTSLEQDEQQYKDVSNLTGGEASSSINLRNALVVRIGEKRILHRAADILEAGVRKHEAKHSHLQNGTSDKKRKPEAMASNGHPQKRAK
jgi:N-lysine methyltransferase SETD6